MRAVVLVGVATLALAVGSAKANLIVNGDFETGGFSGWTLSGNTSEAADTFVGIDTVNGGTHSADLGAEGGLGYLEQKVAVTPGDTYFLSFDLQNDGGTPNQFQLEVDGNLKFILVDAGAFGYGTHTLKFKSTGSTADIKFGFQNDWAYYHLDNVSLVPEPASLAVVGLAAATGLLTARRRRAM